MRSILSILAAIGLAVAPAPGREWSAQPWLDDLAQARHAFATKYANIDRLEHDRALPLTTLFDRAAARLGSARSEAEARAVFEGLVRRVRDGHVAIEWPRSPAPGATVVPAWPTDVCAAMGFDRGRSSAGIAASLAGYQPVGADGPFPAGIISVGRRRVGVIRIGVFDPQGSPALCGQALRALPLPAEKPCDDPCQDAILTWSYDRLTTDLEEQVRAVKRNGATLLLVDITDNGGGTEWAEAAARIVSPKALVSERRGFVRGSHWLGHWTALASALRTAAAAAPMADRTRLLAWAVEAEAARADASQACAETGACALVGRAGYATGLVGTAPAGAFASKPWADLVFSIARFPYHDSVWSGPLVVLVDDETWSAAEEFAAVLRDNHAAVIVGTRTGGAGCGHTEGGTPTLLTNSGATLELPDCVRFRADGSNEVAGVIPDIATGMTASDGAAFKARLIEARLPGAVRAAIAQRSR